MNLQPRRIDLRRRHRDDGGRFGQHRPGTHRVTGFSRLIFAPPVGPTPSDSPAPGYCVVYDRKDEDDRAAMVANALAIGNTAESANGVPRRFDTAIHFADRTCICLGHQSRHEVDDLFLIYVDGDPAGPSCNRACAQLGIVRFTE